MIAVGTSACADGNADTSAVEEAALEAWPGMGDGIGLALWRLGGEEGH